VDTAVGAGVAVATEAVVYFFRRGRTKMKEKGVFFSYYIDFIPGYMPL